MTHSPLIALIFLVMSSISLSAQAKPKVTMRCDTVGPGTTVCAGANVISCRVTVISNMIITTRVYKIRNGCIEGNFKACTLIYFEDIISSPRPGVLVKEPPLKIYVQ